MTTSKKPMGHKVGQKIHLKKDPVMQLRSDVETSIEELKERVTKLEETVQALNDSFEDEERNDE